jgi:glycosyltransferase involved in cell wall biosynthesis
VPAVPTPALRTRQLLVGVAQADLVNEPREYLLELLTGLSAIGVDIQVALFDDGPVRRELEAVADVRRMPELPRESPMGRVQALARRGGPGLADLVHDRRTGATRRWIRPPDCIHLHGPLASPLLQYVRTRGVPVTTYVHPYDFRLSGMPPIDQRRVVDRTDRYLVADDSVVDDLVASGVDPARIEPAPKPLRFPATKASPSERAAARAELGLPGDAVVVGVPPVTDWADAPDLTLALAWELERRSGGAAPTILWHGMPLEGPGHWPVAYDIDRMALRTVRLAGDLPAGIDLFDLVDLVVLPTRSTESIGRYPERAAAHGTPLLCWDGHVLADEVARWKGLLVPRGDVEAMADAVQALADDPAARHRIGQDGWTATLAAVERLAPLSVPAP